MNKGVNNVSFRVPSTKISHGSSIQLQRIRHIAFHVIFLTQKVVSIEHLLLMALEIGRGFAMVIICC